MSENEEIKAIGNKSAAADDSDAIAVKRRRISVSSEDEFSAISMLTTEDFIIKEVASVSEEESNQSPSPEIEGNGEDSITEESDCSQGEVLDFAKVADEEIPADDASYEAEDLGGAPQQLSDNGGEILENTDFYGMENPDEISGEDENGEDENGEDDGADFVSINIFDEADVCAPSADESSGSDDEEQIYEELSADAHTEHKEQRVICSSVKDGKSKRKLTEYDPEHPRKIDFAFDFIEIFVFSLVAVLIFTTVFFRHTVVEGVSMEKTLFANEHLIISNLFYTPQRGDIIVCEDFDTGHRKPIVKRVIAVAGDKVEVLPTYIKVNNEILYEPYVYTDYDHYTNESEMCKTWYIEEGEIFVMGDHRNASDDSRKFGPVKSDSVLGKVIVRFLPFDRFKFFIKEDSQT